MFRSHDRNQKHLFLVWPLQPDSVMLLDSGCAEFKLYSVRKLRRGSAVVDEKNLHFRHLKKKLVKVEETQGKHAWLPKI